MVTFLYFNDQSPFLHKMCVCVPYCNIHLYRKLIELQTQWLKSSTLIYVDKERNWFRIICINHIKFCSSFLSHLRCTFFLCPYAFFWRDGSVHFFIGQFLNMIKKLRLKKEDRNQSFCYYVYIYKRDINMFSNLKQSIHLCSVFSIE